MVLNASSPPPSVGKQPDHSEELGLGGGKISKSNNLNVELTETAQGAQHGGGLGAPGPSRTRAGRARLGQPGSLRRKHAVPRIAGRWSSGVDFDGPGTSKKNGMSQPVLKAVMEDKGEVFQPGKDKGKSGQRVSR